MEIIFWAITAIIGGLVVFEFIRQKPYHVISVYYAGMFIKRFVLPGTRVRETVVIQILLIGVCLLMAYIGYSKRGKKAVDAANMPFMEKGFLLIAVVASMGLVKGYFEKYAIFAMLVDLYKVLEIFLFYFLFTRVWRTTEEMEKAIDLLAIEMCAFGVVEMFTTERGGVGLNMIMSLAPIIFALGFYTRKKRFWMIIVCSLTIVIASKTRTYLLGFILGILLIFFFSNSKKKVRIAITGLCVLVLGISAVSIYAKNTNNHAIRVIIERLMALSQGFEEAGGYRMYEIEMAWQKFLENPLLGKGYGYLEYVYIENQGYFLWGDFMHNTYLELLAKTGIFGALLYGGGLIGYCKKQYQGIRHSRKDKSKETGFLIGGLAGTFCWLFVYFAAPLSSYGYVFIPGMIGLLYSQLSRREQLSEKKFLNGEE